MEKDLVHAKIEEQKRKVIDFNLIQITLDLYKILIEAHKKSDNFNIETMLKIVGSIPECEDVRNSLRLENNDYRANKPKTRKLEFIVSENKFGLTRTENEIKSRDPGVREKEVSVSLRFNNTRVLEYKMRFLDYNMILYSYEKPSAVIKSIDRFIEGDWVLLTINLYNKLSSLRSDYLRKKAEEYEKRHVKKLMKNFAIRDKK
jgi:hypothetical protein